MTKITLTNIKDINTWLENENTPYYFISASNFNLMMMANWLDNWFNINFIDCYDGENTSIILPEYENIPVFEDIEKINQFLLGNKKIVEHIKQHTTTDKPGKVIFLFYDKELEKLVRSLNLNLIMPDNHLVKEIDNKITTTEIGNSANVLSVPNALELVTSYQELRKICKKNGLGHDLVLQSAYGDSGKTTFFVNCEDDYDKIKTQIEINEKIKIMRRISCKQVAIEACTTSNGTFIGPLLTEIIGHPELTPYSGGWCGNDINPNTVDRPTRQHIYQNTERLGAALYQKGYRGYFEVDYLIDTDTDIVYLGEINPRITGITALTNMSSWCSQTIPLFTLHLLEFSEDVDLKIDAKQFNQNVLNSNHRPFGQLIFKSIEPELQIITSIPETGVYQISEQHIEFSRYADTPDNLETNEIFVLRILNIGEYVYKGADLIIVFAPMLMQSKTQGTLSPEAGNIVNAIHNCIQRRSLTDEEKQAVQRYAGHSKLKSTQQYNG